MYNDELTYLKRDAYVICTLDDPCNIPAVFLKV